MSMELILFTSNYYIFHLHHCMTYGKHLLKRCYLWSILDKSLSIPTTILVKTSPATSRKSLLRLNELWLGKCKILSPFEESPFQVCLDLGSHFSIGVLSTFLHNDVFQNTTKLNTLMMSTWSSARKFCQG